MDHSHKSEEEEKGSKGENEYEVEKIVAHQRMNKRGRPKYEYLVKWKHYSNEDNTWETKENITRRKKGKKKRSTLDKDDDEIYNTTTVPESKQHPTLVDPSSSKRRKSTQNDNDDPHPGSTNSNSNVDQGKDVDLDNEQAKEVAPVIARVNIVKPPENYQWTDGEVISAVLLDTGDILTKIAWPNGEVAYRICR
ncbi:hypothetical protein INT45_011130 [Circinella minor]|uniref:Chromo domain-containing protein n=1 Tax=Circinella minor TaxID=1195481 RepID=A0A8H7VTL8_9FUNG|nr:hypothetical protein INT45_011130 [Circinella minor]